MIWYATSTVRSRRRRERENETRECEQEIKERPVDDRPFRDGTRAASVREAKTNPTQVLITLLIEGNPGVTPEVPDPRGSAV